MFWHDAFYRFVNIDDPDALVVTLKTLCQGAGVLGSILVASEGMNGMLAGTEEQLEKVHDCLNNDARFTKMLVKRTACNELPFKRLKIKRKNEIVPLGLSDVDATTKTGMNVSPKEWRELIKRDDVVLLDNRNSFEYQHGHFKNAVDPGVEHFRDFAKYVEDNLQKWHAENKTIAMYCTGGIRCEKTTAWLASLGVAAYQLEGGILNYFKETPDAAQDYDGTCFVFDERRELTTELQQKTKL